jgi:zinc finger protein
MDEVPVEIPCPICSKEGQVRMMTHIDEIPYFGEHTQVTVLCHACGWRQTDFIPAEGAKPGGCQLVISKPEHIRARVVRSSSCTVRIPELDLEVKPGTASTGYVSNVEGVIDRFMEIIVMVTRQCYADDAAIEDIQRLQEMHTTLLELKEDPIPLPVTVEFLDPNGHSQILHSDAVMRELEGEELEDLPVGPEAPVFSQSDLAE